jgi:hypothetical protein
MPDAATKPCERCSTQNPGAANFCFHCGWPFGREALAAAPPVAEPPDPFADWSESTDRVEIDNDRAREDIRARLEELAQEAADSEPPPPPEDQAPFPARLYIEEGPGSGTTFPLRSRETLLGAKAEVDLSADPFVGSRAALLTFEEDRLYVRDDGSANGVYFKLREPARLRRGDQFIAGERLVRYDGAVNLPADPPNPGFLGATRPEGPVLRMAELLRGGTTGRICYRKGPVISVGRSGCDLNFSTDQRISAKHAEIRVGPDGTVMLADLGTARSGVLLRLRPNEPLQLFDGDVLQLGGVLLRVKFS